MVMWSTLDDLAIYLSSLECKLIDLGRSHVYRILQSRGWMIQRINFLLQLMHLNYIGYDLVKSAMHVSPECLSELWYVLVLQVGYIVMMDPSTGTRTNLLRMRGAGVVGVYHPLVDEKLVKILHRYLLLSIPTP